MIFINSACYGIQRIRRTDQAYDRYPPEVDYMLKGILQNQLGWLQYASLCLCIFFFYFTYNLQLCNNYMVFHYYALLSTLSTELSTFFLIVCVLFVYCLTFYIHLSFHIFAVPAFSYSSVFLYHPLIQPLSPLIPYYK